MSQEFLWGQELNATKREYVWDMQSKGEEDNCLCYNLVLKHAVLGSKVPKGEVNVVELETSGVLAQEIKQPLIKLVAGQTEECTIDILINYPKSVLRLTEGSGPVYLWGQHLIELNRDEDYEGESETGQVEDVELDSDEDDEKEEDTEALKEEMRMLAEEQKAAETKKLLADEDKTPKKKRKSSVQLRDAKKKMKLDEPENEKNGADAAAAEAMEEEEKEVDSPQKKKKENVVRKSGKGARGKGRTTS